MATIRLTLRTLLAYLDNTLEADQAKVIGQKIAESELAQKLIERIKEVTHNSQLPAPLVAGPGAKVDANVVAEYLDSVLEDDKLAKLEEILLKSDVLLAEVVASHQILTRFLSQPAQVSPETLERMVNLKEARGKKKKARAPEPVAAEEDDQEVEDDEDEDDDEDSEDDLDIGAPLKARPRNVPLLPALLLLLLVAGVGYLILQTLTNRPPDPVAAFGETKATIIAKTEPTVTKATETKKNDTAVTKTTETKKNDTTDKKDTGVEKKKDEPAPQPKVEVPVKKEAIDQLLDTRPSSERREAGKMLPPLPALPAALLRRDQAGPWQRMKANDKVQTAEPLLSLPGYRSKVQMAGGVELTLFGQLPEFATHPPELAAKATRPPIDPMLECCVIPHAPAAGFDADLTLERGRIVLANVKGREPVRVRVRFAGEIWDLTLLDNQSVTAVELFGIYPPEVPFRATPGGDGPYLEATVTGLKGNVELEVRYQTFGLPPPSIFVWTNRDGPAPGPRPSPMPTWFSDPVPPAAARDFRAALDDLDARMNQKPVEVALIELRKQARPAAKAEAVRGLGAIDALGELLAALTDEQDPISRALAFHVFVHWIGRNADNEQVLFKLLGQKGYTPAQAETIMELLHLFSKEASENPATYEKLIANLRHDKLAIRQLSYWHLMKLVPWQKIPYDPAGTPAQLDEGVQQWKKLIPDGKLPPLKK